MVSLIELIPIISEYGLTDPTKANFLASIGIPDASWIKIIAESNLTNSHLGSELYWTNMPQKDAATLNASINALNGAGVSLDSPFAVAICRYSCG